jgi:hypothetical protein
MYISDKGAKDTSRDRRVTIDALDLGPFPWAVVAMDLRDLMYVSSFVR